MKAISARFPGDELSLSRPQGRVLELAQQPFQAQAAVLKRLGQLGRESVERDRAQLVGKRRWFWNASGYRYGQPKHEAFRAEGARLDVASQRGDLFAESLDLVGFVYGRLRVAGGDDFITVRRAWL